MQSFWMILVRLSEEEQMRLAEEGSLTISEAKSGQGYLEYRVAAHSDDAKRLIEKLENLGADFRVEEDRRFSTKELRTAQALHVEPPEECASVVLDAEKWDWTKACPRCMRIPESSGPLTMKSHGGAGYGLLRGRRGEIVVHERVAIRMIKEKISGCILREVKNPDERAASPWFQVMPTSVLPPVSSPPTRFMKTEESCPTCGRGGLELGSMLYYDVDLTELADINVTREVFGSGSSLHQEIVVSPRFYNLLVAQGARFSSPEPVLFI